MSEERPRKWDGWNVLLLGFLVVIGFAQTYQSYVAIKQGQAAIKQGEAAIKQGEMANRDRAEQMRPRLSFQIRLPKIDDPAKFLVVAPIEIGGITGARNVTFKTYLTPDRPGQRDYLYSIKVDWDRIERHGIWTAPLD